MALFGGERDISLFRHLNRELLGEIILQQCAFYKPNLQKTTVNMYGEAAYEKYWIGPVLFNCLIEVQDKTSFEVDGQISTGEVVNFNLLKDDLEDNNYVPEIGDIILYEEEYFEVHNTVSNQRFVGKDPDYPNEDNPLTTNLKHFGWDVSIICQTHVISADRPGITKERLK